MQAEADGTTDSKGVRTRARNLDEAARLASVQGVPGVTLGVLADRLGLSKSGMFAHFGSKEALEIAILDHVAARATEMVFNAPAPTDLSPRACLAWRFGRWLDWVEGSVLPGGCPFQSAQSDYDDRPGPVRDRLVRHLQALRVFWMRALRGLQPAPDRDRLEQAVFELEGLIQAFARAHRLLRDPNARARAETGFAGIVDRLSPG